MAYVGDGAWGMSLNEMLTCVRENIAVVAVVFNNQQWGAEKKNQVGCLLYIYRLLYTLHIYLSTYLQVDFYSDRYVGTNLDNPSFAEISRAMGGEGVTVTRPEEVLILFRGPFSRVS